METSPEAMLTIIIGMKKGETRSGPFSLSVSWVLSSVWIPPIPEPISTPKRVPSTSVVSSTASSPAMTLQAIAYCKNGSSRRASFLSTDWSGSKFLTSAAIRVANSYSPWAFFVVASNFVMGPTPDRACLSADQNSSAVLPTGVSAPSPVTTTRRVVIDRAPRARPEIGAPSRILLDVLDRVADGHDLLGILVGDLDVEMLLESHDELNRVERIGAQILDELRVRGDLVLLHPELLDDDLLHLLLHRLRHELVTSTLRMGYMYIPPLTWNTWPVM